MNTKNIISELLLDSLVRNDTFPLHNILSFLIEERAYNLDRIRHIARKYFYLPDLTIEDLLLDFSGQYFH